MSDNTALAPYRQALQQSGVYYPVAVPQKPPGLWDTYRAAIMPSAEPMSHVQAAVGGIRHTLETSALASLLGLIHGKWGLDIAGKYPVDGIAAAVLLMMSIKEAHKPDGFSSDLRTLSQTCTSVAFFRHTSDWVSKPKIEAAADMSRHSSPEDPILAAAKKYNL